MQGVVETLKCSWWQVCVRAAQTHVSSLYAACLQLEAVCVPLVLLVIWDRSH